MTSNPAMQDNHPSRPAKPQDDRSTNRPVTSKSLFDVLNRSFNRQRKQSPHTMIMLLFSGCLAASLACVYFVLQQFLRSLLWALLLGFVLHPFKRRLAQAVRDWLQELDAKRTPLLIEVVQLPFTLINHALSSIFRVLKQYARLLLFVFVALLLVHLSAYYFTFTQRLMLFATKVIQIAWNVAVTLDSYTNLYVLSTIAICHFVLLVFFWNEASRDFIVYSTPVVWLSSLYKLLLMLDTLGILILIMSVLLVLGGLVASLFSIQAPSGLSHPNDEIKQSMLQVASSVASFFRTVARYGHYLLPSSFYNLDDESGTSVLESADFKLETAKVKRSDSVATNDSSTSNVECKSPAHTLSQISLGKTPKLSHAYLYSLLWSCFLAQIYLRPQLLYLLPIPASLYAFKSCLGSLKQTNFYRQRRQQLLHWIATRSDAICNPLFRLIYEYMLISNHLVATTFLASIHSISSILVILVMIFVILFATIFLAFQVYNESALLVEFAGNIIPSLNQTLAANPELKQMLPDNILKGNLLAEMLDKGYLHGRDWLQNWIRNTFGSETDAISTLAIEKQLLEVWDRVYHLWLVPGNHSECLQSQRPGQEFEAYNWNKLFAALKTLNLSLVFNLMKGNLDTILSVFESIWKLLKGNVTVLFTSFSAIISILLSGSSAILNTTLNLIVFLTSLFYLLASSEEQYRPLEMAGKLIIHLTGSDSRTVLRFEKAVEDSIRSIFKATLKMSTFYGLYTWLLLTLFDLQLIYIPSVLAALFGAVPFIGAYWAFLPGMLELWLIHKSNAQTIYLVLLAMTPSYFVDTAVYSEIKGGGHPYMTGLAIAGGVLYLGFEGAVIGPLLLCCICVIVNFCASLNEDVF